jgi:Spy/CpxP family protein refolding chaperone
VASTLKVIFAVSGIFVAGAVTGGFVSLRVADHVARKQRDQARFGVNEIGGRLAEQLQLTEEQKKQIRPIISSTAEGLRKIRLDAFSETATLIAKMDADMAKLLTPEQQALLKDMRMKEDARRKQWMADRAKRPEPRPPVGPNGNRSDGERPYGEPLRPEPPPEP